MTGLLSAITAVCALAALILEAMAAHRKKKEEQADALNIQTFRTELAEADSDDIAALAAAQHDRVQSALRGYQRGRDSGGGKNDSGQPVQ